jgi:membrane fusion protein (multidrug efflux system)
MKKYIKIQLWIPVMALLLAACDGNGTEETGLAEASVAEREGKVTTVEVVNPKSRDFTAQISIVGTAKPNQVVKLHAMESGYVQKLHKDIGDPVKAGEVIAVLKNPEVERQYQKQKAMREAKKSIYDRLNSIAQKTPALTSLQQLETAKAEYESTQAEFNAMADRMGFLTVKSPFDGVVTKRFVDKGALVQSGISNSNALPLVEIMELKTIRLSVPLPETDVSTVKPGTKATVVFPELAGEVFEAEVSRLSRALNPGSKAMDVELDIENENLAIKPGMYAKVKMQISSRDGVLSVPNTALVVYQDDFFVYAVEGGIVKRLPIRSGLQNKDYFEILDADIKPSTQVIVRGKNLVEPGMKVEPIQTTEQ